jgi:S-adenosylmethionine hydrolase
MAGRIIYIDSYGNLLTMSPRKCWGSATIPTIETALQESPDHRHAPHFAAVPFNHPLMYWAVRFARNRINQGSAARKWSAQQGEFFELEWV